MADKDNKNANNFFADKVIITNCICIVILGLLLIVLGSSDILNDLTRQKKCEQYLNGTYDVDSKTCNEVVVETPHEEPEKHLNSIFDKRMGEKANCDLISSDFPDTKKYPFKQKVSAICNGLKMNITFTESLNEHSKKFIEGVRQFNNRCSRYIEAAPSLVQVSGTYRYDFKEFGTRVSKHLVGYKELSTRDAQKPLVCYVPVHKRVIRPERNLSEIFKAKCVALTSEFPDLNDASKQIVTGICDGMNIRALFDNVQR